MTLGSNATTTSVISDRTMVYAEKKMLAHASPHIVLDKFGMMKQMPQNKTSTVKYRRPRVFAAQTTPIQEGVTPPATGFSYEDVTGTLQQYGQVEVITDQIEDFNEDPVLNDISTQLGENIGRTAEALDWASLRAGTNVFYANGSSRGDVNTKISLSKQRAVVRGLKKQKGMKITKVMDSSPGYNTFSVESAYVAVCHTDCEQDIRDLPGFKNVADYGNRKTVCDHELGTVEDVRYVCSPDLDPFVDAGGTPGSTVVSSSGSAADVYPILFFAREAYAKVALRGLGAIEPTIIPVGNKTKDDPLGQRGYAGWKMYHLCLITNDLWMARLEVAVSEL